MDCPVDEHRGSPRVTVTPHRARRSGDAWPVWCERFDDEHELGKRKMRHHHLVLFFEPVPDPPHEVAVGRCSLFEIVEAPFEFHDECRRQPQQHRFFVVRIIGHPAGEQVFEHGSRRVLDRTRDEFHRDVEWLFGESLEPFGTEAACHRRPARLVGKTGQLE